MWPMRTRVKDARNVFFDAALEFGNNWRRDLMSLARERLPELDAAEQDLLASEIDQARSSIEHWILDRWQAARGEWHTADAQDARPFIAKAYPWMDPRNVEHAISQGTHYAWHG